MSRAVIFLFLASVGMVASTLSAGNTISFLGWTKKLAATLACDAVSEEEEVETL